MVTKTSKSSSTKTDNPHLRSTVKDSAQQIWLAGLGAFAKAQEEGGKVFEALVREGTSIQRKTQSAAEVKITEATSKMASMATDISSRASGQWGKLEDIFEERVSKAMGKLGVPSAKALEELAARIAALEKERNARAAPAAKKASAKAAPAKKAAARKTAK